MTRKELRSKWKALLKTVPAGTNAYDAARRLGEPYQTVRFWMRRLRFKSVDGRIVWTPERIKRDVKLDPNKVRWFDHRGNRFSYALIGRKHGVSRERVRQVAKVLGIRDP